MTTTANNPMNSKSLVDVNQVVGVLQELATPEHFQALQKLDADLKRASTTMTAHEARYTVDAYYMVQSYRIRLANQIRAFSGSEEPHDLIRWLYQQVEGLEKSVQGALNTYSNSQQAGKWLRSVVGIGPVIAAGYLAHIDITKSTNPAKLFRFSGFDPTAKWERGQKRPWNASLKRLGFLVGESFVKTQNRHGAYYGQLYVERKKLETQANGYHFYQEQARRQLQEKKFSKDTEAFKAYTQGVLPLAHIHARARRFAVKRLLSHYWTVLYEITYNEPAPKPYAIARLGHVDYVPPWNWPMTDALSNAAHDEELVEIDRPIIELDREPIPFSLPYPTLEQQLQQFQQALDLLDVPQLDELQGSTATEGELLQGLVEQGLTPTLAERLATFTYTTTTDTDGTTTSNKEGE